MREGLQSSYCAGRRSTVEKAEWLWIWDLDLRPRQCEVKVKLLLCCSQVVIYMWLAGPSPAGASSRYWVQVRYLGICRSHQTVSTRRGHRESVPVPPCWCLSWDRSLLALIVMSVGCPYRGVRSFKFSPSKECGTVSSGVIPVCHTIDLMHSLQSLLTFLFSCLLFLYNYMYATA